MVGVDDRNKWKTFRKFFVSLNTQIQFDFSGQSEKIRDAPSGSAFEIGEDLLKQYSLSKILPFIFGKVVSFEPKVNEIKVLKEDKEVTIFDTKD